MPWLSDILKSGDLKDNRTYVATDGEFSNTFRKECLLLNHTGRGAEPWNKETWKFLAHAAHEVSQSLENKTPNSLVIFNEAEYTHNTDHPFFQIHGTDSLNVSLQTGNLVGCVKRGEYSLKISSRFGDAFLRYIIADADGFLEMKDYGGQQDDGFKWLLVYLWVIKLKRAYRLGLPKSYVSKTETMPRVRGKIHPVEYFLHGDRAAYKCSYREHSYCNSATILIAETFRSLKGDQFLDGVHALANNFAVASEGLRSDRRTLLSTPHFSNPFYSDYNGLIDLSKRILRDESTDFGENSDTSAFFFDVSMLFEYFVRKLIKRSGAQLQPKKDKRWKIPSGRSKDYQYHLQPDLLFEIEGRIQLFDVKYKSYDFRYGVARDDLFQLHTYLGQCSNVYEIATCGFIYPISAERWESEGMADTNGCMDEIILFGTREIPFRVLFLRVPAASDHFNEDFKQSCAVFLDQLNSPLHTR